MAKEPLVKMLLRWLLAAVMVAIGVQHFRRPEFFLKIMPTVLPWHLELVYLSGFFEVLGGLGLLIPQTRKAAAWGLIALYLCVFPANINMAINEIQPEPPLPIFLLWLRLPVQALPIALCWWFTRGGAPVDTGGEGVK